MANPIRERDAPALTSADPDTRAPRRAPHDLLDLVVRNAPEFIAVADPSGYPVFANDAALRLVGMDWDDVRTTPVLEYFVPEEREFVRDVVLPAMLETGQWEGELTLQQRTTGQRVPVFYHIFRVDDPETGEPLYFAAITRDITERKRAEQALREAKEAAEEANRLKSQFLSTISHELRTPLTALIGTSDLLGTGVLGPVTAKQQAHIARIKAGAWHLVAMIDEILTYSRSEAGHDEVTVTDVDLAAIAREVGAMLRPEAEARGLELRLDDAGVPAPCRTDGGKVRQILTNLLSNAIKYTHDGTVQVTVRHEPRHVAIRVSDTGPGIPADRLEDIFEPFVRLQTPGTAAGGTGLGLAISRRLARLLDSDVVVESTPGRGSTFSLTLPKG